MAAPTPVSPPAVALSAGPGVETADVIRCPDWQRYVTPVVLARLSDDQTDAAFLRRTRVSSSRSDSQTDSVRSDSGTRETDLRPDPKRVPAGRLLPGAGTRTDTRTDTPAKTRACTHTVRAGDTFGQIAETTLGSARRWRAIAAVNPGVDPRRLRVDQVIHLPCAPDSAAETPARPSETDGATIPAASRTTGWSWWPFGRTAPTSSAAPASSSPSADGGTDTGTEAIDAVTVPPLPTWEAAADDYLRDVLRRWGATAGYTVIIDTADAWQLDVPVRIKAEFEAAVDELVNGLAHDGTPPRVRLYPNAVLRLGGPL